MAEFRSHGWNPEELKVYWDAKQLEDLCPREEVSLEQTPEAQQPSAVETTGPVDGKDDITVDEKKEEKVNEVVGVQQESKAKEEGPSEVANDQEKPETKEERANEVANDEQKSETKEVKPSEVVDDQQKSEAKEGGEGEAVPVQVETKDEVKVRNQRPMASKPFLHDPSDADAVRDLRQNPVDKRNHAVKITYVNKGIEKAVFDAPEDVQLIVLNFAVSSF